MWLWQSLKASVHDPVFYQTMKDRRFGPAIGFFALVIFVVSIISSLPAIRGVASFVFQSSERADMIRQQALDMYPDWLEVRSGGGRLSMNAESPYAVPMPRGVLEQNEPGMPANLMVIDTEKRIELSDFEKYDTPLIIGADEIGVYDKEQGKFEVRQIGEFLKGPGVLDKKLYTEFISKIERMIKGFGVLFLVLMPITVFLGSLSLHLLYLLFGALAVWAAAGIRKADWQYGTAYKAGLYLITLPIIFAELVSLGVIPETPVPFFFTLLLFILALINIPSGPKPAEEVPSTPPAEAPKEEVHE